MPALLWQKMYLVLGLFLATALPPVAHASLEAGEAAYRKGDYAAALRAFRPLAEQGQARAQFNLGVLYDDGRGVPQDHREAAKWFRLAAEQGNATAQNNLGLMFERGEAGLGPNLEVAYALFNLSATGDPSAANPAIRNRDSVRAALSPRALDAAQALTRALARPGNFAKALQDQLARAARRGGNK